MTLINKISNKFSSQQTIQSLSHYEGLSKFYIKILCKLLTLHMYLNFQMFLLINGRGEEVFLRGASLEGS